MVFLFGKISEHHPNSSGNRVFRCSLAKLQQTFFNDFLFDFWANIFETFKQDFLLITWSKETSFGFEKLGEDCKSIFRKLYSSSNKPTIFSKWLILWRKSWTAFLSFVAEVKLSIFSWLSGKISASMSHFLRLKVLFLENYFCDFSTRFSPLGLAAFVEKNVSRC